MFRGILIGVLTLAVAGTSFWGYQEHREKNAVLLNAENNYQRAFHDLTYHVDLLHDKIGTTLAMNSRQSLSPALAEVWRITSEAHNGVGQLPLTLLPFNKTEEFLKRIGDFSYQTAVRDLDKEPLNDQEYNALKELYTQSAEIQQELRNVQHMVLKNNLRWMDVELALASGKEQADNTIIDGFKTVEKAVEGYAETDFGPAFVNMKKNDDSYNNLKGKNISEKEAVNIARKYAKMGNDVKTEVAKNEKGSDYEFYSVSLEDRKTNQIANLDITKKGGYPIWYILSRDVTTQKLSLNDASQKGIKFLTDNGFKDLTLFESTQYDNIGVFTFVREVNGVKIYPEAIKMKVALDNGQIIGFSEEDYLKTFNADRVISKPGLTLEQAKSKINPQVKVMEDGLSIIVNDLNKEVLCYEFLGTLDNETYRIFINADSGIEEKVEKMNSAEPIYEDLV